LTGKAYAAFRAQVDIETFIGAGLAVQLPTGEYHENRLINLGTNRITVRPQLDIVHNRGPWSFEGSAIAAMYTDNDEFFGGNVLEQDPFFYPCRTCGLQISPGPLDGGKPWLWLWR
jgi:hypothetical protein